MSTLRLPKAFLVDHRERDLPTPMVLRETVAHFLVDDNDPLLPDLLDDARFYAHPDAPDWGGLRAAAKALLKAVKP